MPATERIRPGPRSRYATLAEEHVGLRERLGEAQQKIRAMLITAAQRDKQVQRLEADLRAARRTIAELKAANANAPAQAEPAQ